MAAPKKIRKKNNSTLPTLLAAVLLLGGGAYFYMNSMEDPAVAKKAAEKPFGKVAVPTLNRDLARGQVVTVTEIAYKYLAPEDVPEDIIISSKVFRGRWLIGSMSKGDYIREGDLALKGAPKGYSGILPEGKRIFVVPVKGIVGTTGYMQVGDIVDVYSTGGAAAVAKKASQTTSGNQPGQAHLVNAANKAKQAEISGSSVARLLATAAEVVLTPKKTREGNQENVVLAVDSQESVQLMFAVSGNELLQFIYRPFGENGDGIDAFIEAVRDPRLVDVIKGTKRRDIMPKMER